MTSSYFKKRVVFTQDKYKQVVRAVYELLVYCIVIESSYLGNQQSFCLGQKEEWELPDWTSSYPAVLVVILASQENSYF